MGDFNFNKPMKGNDAILQDVNGYYDTMYSLIRNYATNSLAKNPVKMFSFLSELSDLTACRFKPDERAEIYKKIDELDEQINCPTPNTTREAIFENNKFKQSKVKEIKKVYRNMMVLLNKYEMLVPTFRQDTRPTILQ